MTRALLVLALGGCNQLYGLDETRPLDPQRDGDRDGVIDADDNCRTIANPTQSDKDRDGLGDACDNCALVPNRAQDAIGDADDVGDACDPHPDVAGDCLVLFDSFSEPAAFDSHWTRISGTGTITPTTGSVSIAPVGTGEVTLVARDDAGQPLTGAFDVQLAARTKLTSGIIRAVSNASGQSVGYQCMVFKSLGGWYLNAGASSGTASITSSGYVGDEVVRDDVLLRLTSATPADPTVKCRVDYGVAAGAGESLVDATQMPAGGSPGLRAYLDPVEITAIAVYHFDPSASCAPPIMR